MVDLPERRSNEPSGDVTPIPVPEPARLPSAGASDEAPEVIELHDLSQSASRQQVKPAGWREQIQAWWVKNIYMSVPYKDCRDHLANERTYLSFQRTAIAFSILGVLIAQLYRLQRNPQPDHTFGYFVVGVPLASIFQVAAITTALLGGLKFCRQQTAMARGKVHSGGWEVMTMACGSAMLLLTLFALHVGIAIYKDAG